MLIILNIKQFVLWCYQCTRSQNTAEIHYCKSCYRSIKEEKIESI